MTTHGSDNPVLWSTTRAYQADWDLFTTWCHAANHAPLPAAPDTVAQFLRELPAAVATWRRRVTAINTIHREHGYPEPGKDEAVRQLIRNPPTHHPPVVDPAVVARAIRRLPTSGWPAGMFGRRDALLLTLRYKADLTLAQLVNLTSDRIRIVGDAVEFDLAPGRVVRLETADEAAVCPPCVWRRWQIILTAAAGYAAAWKLTELLTPPTDPNDDHLCTSDAPDRLVRRVPVFMPIDRWGSLPLPLRPTTTRTAITLTAGHLAGTIPAHHVQPDSEAEQQTAAHGHEPEQVEPVPPRPDYTQIHQAGLAARAAAVAQLCNVDTALGLVDQAVDELNRRLMELLS
ncbi:hypothetical protein D1871_04680 [Nakamurella silvestris]|nr:hypothetical protein D1871_04680 [Nakamurella silvestris]